MQPQSDFKNKNTVKKQEEEQTGNTKKAEQVPMQKQNEVLINYFNEGNQLFKEQKYIEAHNVFKHIIDAYDNVSKSERNKYSELFKNTFIKGAEMICLAVNVHTNRSEFNDTEKMYLYKALEYLDKSLTIDPFDTKAKDLFKGIVMHFSFFEKNSQLSIRLLTRCLIVDPYDYVLHYNLGFTYHKLNNLESAVFHYKLAYRIIEKELEIIKINKEDDELTKFLIKVLNGLGGIYFNIQQKNLAKTYFLKAYTLNEEDPDICNQLAVVYTDERLTEKAIDFYKKGIANADKAHISNDPNVLRASMYMNMGLMYSYECDIPTAISCYNKSLEYKPRFSLAFQNKLLDLNYVSHELKDPMYLTKTHKLINKTYDQVITNYRVSLPNYVVKDLSIPKTKLNIGFVSGDFVCHPVNYFIASVFDNLDYTQFNVFCYSTKVVKLDNRFKDVNVKCIRNTSSQEAKNIIANDNIDILFDLSGHTGDNRIDIFALKAAPIQINYIGYPNTTGLASMDYRITDPNCDSAKSEKYCSEKLIYIPNSFLCYTPGVIMKKMTTKEQIEHLPKLTKLQPATVNKHVTFGCFNRFNKINSYVVSVWEKILQKAENARLVIKTKEFTSEKNKSKFLNMFQDRSVLDRVTILPYSDGYSKHLPDYNKIDIALDTFPYSGTTTSCESLMMGVPVLTLFDNDRHYHSQNVTSSLMKNSNLSEYISQNVDEYISKAVAFSKNLDLLANLKTDVRDKFTSGHVFKKEEFTHGFQSMLTQLYTQHFKSKTSNTTKTKN
jgi:protein O-GlcNAc transferase